MKTPRDVSGLDLAKALKIFDYERIRQDASHIRMTTQLKGEHHLSIPNHRSLKIGTLKSIFRLVAAHQQISVEAVMAKLDL